MTDASERHPEHHAATLRVPLLADQDVIVAGGTVAGVHIAVELAARGYRVTLLVQGSSVPHEIAAAMRAWVHSDAFGTLTSLTGATAAALAASCNGERLHVGHATQSLEDLLLDAGVTVYYDTYPAGALVGDRLCGAVVGGKFGVAALTAGLVVDCTPEATFARSAGVRFSERAATTRAVSQVYHCGSQTLVPSEWTSGGLTFSLRPPFVDITTRADCQLSAAEVALEVRERLIAEATGAAGERIAALEIDRGADDPVLAPRRRLVSDFGSRSQAGAFDVRQLIPAEGDDLLVWGPSCDGSDDLADRLSLDWVFSLARTEEITAAILTHVAKRLATASSSRPERFRLRTADDPDADSALEGRPDRHLRARDPGYEERDTELITLEIPALPVLASADTLVVGGGTAGAPAAMVAAADEASSANARTLCVEKHGDLGGANTIGGVSAYWYGRWSRYFRAHFRRLASFTETTGLPSALGQLALVRDAGADVLLRTPAAGVGYVDDDGTRVTELLVCGPDGLACVRANQFVDATGDGDLCAWAGAAYAYGCERDDLTLWASFGKFHSGRAEASRHYFTVADQRSISDITRAIVAGRRQTGVFGEAEFPQHYLVTRESRHIDGRARIRYVEMLADVDWSDAVLVCRSNVDIKGLAGSDAAFAGFVERCFLRNYVTRVPFRAMVPRRLRNVLLAGKAYSMSHDAGAMARMQTDMIAMGAVAGLAVALARRSACDVSAVSVPHLQEACVEVGTIERAELSGREEHAEHGLSDDDLEVACRRAGVAAMELDDQARILAQGGRAVPFLRRALGDGSSRHASTVARMLCVLGDRAGNDVLLDRLAQQLADSELPRLEHTKHFFPDHGFAPEPAYLICALALIRETRLLPHLAELVDRLDVDPRLSDDRFAYVHAVAYALERLAVADCVPIGLRLLTSPALNDRLVLDRMDIRLCADPVAERFAYLNLCLSRALARCGERTGWERLVGFLRERRSFLYRSAHAELRELSGVDLGYDPKRWFEWLESSDSWTVARPLTRRFD